MLAVLDRLVVEVRWDRDLLWHVWDSQAGVVEQLSFFGSQDRVKTAAAVYARKRAPSVMVVYNKSSGEQRRWTYD